MLARRTNLLSVRDACVPWPCLYITGEELPFGSKPHLASKFHPQIPNYFKNEINLFAIKKKY